MTGPRSTLVVLTSVFILAGVNRARAQGDPASDAIDRGIDFLLPSTQKLLESVEAKYASGTPTPGQDPHDIGKLTLEVYGLVVAGVSVQNPTIKKSFEFLERIRFSHTYTTALYIFALDAAIAQLEDDLLMLQPQKVQQRFRDDASIGKEYRPRLQAAVESFVQSQNGAGVWHYAPPEKGKELGARDFDNSNVQFAVLALGVGAKRRVPMDPSVWMRILDHFVKGQQKKGDLIRDRLTMRPREERGKKRDEVKLIAVEGAGGDKEKKEGKSPKDKESVTIVKRDVTAPPNPENPELGTEVIDVFQRGWDYSNKGDATWNMTCAGLSSLLLVRENLRGKISGDTKVALDKGIRDGYGWLMGHWSPAGPYYGMYSLEKVGDIGEVDRFGAHDWHKELSSHLIGSQQANGNWPKGNDYEADEGMATAFALLILNRASSLLTQSPVSRIVVSGKNAGPDTPNDRSWVYVPDLDTTIHYPSLLRAIRQRPSPKLLRFLENIVDNYPDERKGELVPDLAYVRDSMSQKTAQKTVDDYLVKITGYRYKNPEDYQKWHRRWERIIKIGEGKKRDQTALLLQYYQSTTRSVPLKKAIMWALVQVAAKEAIPLLLADMEHSEAAVRQAAYSYFRAYFLDFPPPFDPSAPDAVREKQVAAVKEWLAKQG